MSVTTPEAAIPRLPDHDLLLVSVLGEGGSAMVYRAWRIDAGEWCAVKVLKPGKNAKLRKRFLTEARMLCDLSHRNLVKGFQVSDTDPPWFSMEIADGGSLKDWCTRHGSMAPRLAVEVAIQICKGVSVAHLAGYVHRDIKPHNVLVNRRGVCKLTDFGVARVAITSAPNDEPPDFSTSADALGTLGYMSPEQQADPSSVDPRSDVYGIGATLLHLLTGQPPPGNLFMAAREYPELFEGIPDPLVPVIRKATEYRRDDRYANALELARELHAVSEFLPPAPKGSPTLTTGIAIEPMPPPGMVSRTPVSGPSIDSGPSSIPPGGILPREEVATASPVAVRRTSQPTMQRPGGPPVSATRWPLVVALLFAQVFLAFSADVYWVGSSRRAAQTAAVPFDATVRRHVAIVDELAGAGADRAELEAAFGRMRSESLLAQRDAAEAWLALLRSSADAHPPEPRVQVVVRTRIDELEAAFAPWDAAVDTWTARATGFPGNLVSGFLRPPDKAAGGDR